MMSTIRIDEMTWVDVKEKIEMALKQLFLG